jgi:hypothetical protein
MEDIYIELMNKNKHSNTNTQKYKIISCQKTINNNNNTTGWIKLEEVIKKHKDLIIFNALLLKSTKIVVKIGKSDTILKEYKISHLLSNITGFIKYLCYFSCNNNIDTIINNSSICADKGEPIKILLMKKYKLGDIKNYNWNIDNFYILKILIKQIFTALFEAFIMYGFLHNDVHFGNFLINNTSDNQYQVIIMDFENSLFDLTKNDNLDILYQNYEQILNNILWELNIFTENMEITINYIKSNKNKLLDINNLLNLIDNIIFIKKRDLSQILKYNPNLFY